MLQFIKRQAKLSVSVQQKWEHSSQTLGRHPYKSLLRVKDVKLWDCMHQGLTQGKWGNVPEFTDNQVLSLGVSSRIPWVNVLVHASPEFAHNLDRYANGISHNPALFHGHFLVYPGSTLY